MKKRAVKKGAWFALVVIAVLATACAGGDSDNEPDALAFVDSPLVGPLAEEILTGPDALTTDRAEAACFARGTVAGIGEARLVELGLSSSDTPDLDSLDLTDAEVTTLVGSMFDCIDVQQMIADSMTADGVDAEDARCLADSIDELVLRSAMIDQMRGVDIFENDLFFNEIFAGAEACSIEF